MVGATRIDLTTDRPAAGATHKSTMFGFLRRKPKPGPQDAAPQADAAVATDATSAGETSARAGPAVATPTAPAVPATRLAAVGEPAAPETVPEAPPETVAGPQPEAVAGPQPEALPDPQLEPLPDRTSWRARLRQGMSRTRANLAGVFGASKIDESMYEDLETALLASDVGVAASASLIEALRVRVRRERLREPGQLPGALRAEVTALLAPLEKPIDIDRAQPLVMMIAGVNGAGKTTSIGKLAHHLQREGKSILLAAGDTFRAAAREQLAEWGARNSVQVIAQQGGDPAAVAFDAVAAGRARGLGVVMVDTAGRLPTQTHLMDELKKIRRVIAKAMPDAPHEVLLVLDGNTGQNMLSQVEAFDRAVALTGLVVTKLDGTAKGGALVALAHTRRDRPVPVYFVGVGEAIDDLQAFSASEFAAALID